MAELLAASEYLFVPYRTNADYSESQAKRLETAVDVAWHLVLPWEHVSISVSAV